MGKPTTYWSPLGLVI